MKFCQECGVYVNKDVKNCPLCGSFVCETDNLEYAEYAENEDKIKYPKLKLSGDAHRNFLRKKSFFISLSIIAVCVLINLLMTQGSLWSAYVAVGILTFYLCIISPVYKRMRFYFLTLTLSFVLPVAAILIDLLISVDLYHNFSLFGISIMYIVPSILLAFLLTLDIFSAAEKSKYKYYLLVLLIVSLMSLAPQIFVWASGFAKHEWFTFTLFSFSILNALIMSIIYAKPLAAEFKRKFNINS